MHCVQNVCMHFITCFEEWQNVIFGGLSLISIKMVCCYKYGTCQLASGHAEVFCIWLHKTMAQLFIRICENREYREKAAKNLMNNLLETILADNSITDQLLSESSPVQEANLLGIWFSQLQKRLCCFSETFAISLLKTLVHHILYIFIKW